MHNLLKFLITDEHNQYDFGILVWIASCFLFLYRSWTAPWDGVAFGVGLAGVLGSGAALKWISTKVPAAPDITVGNATGPTAPATTTNSVGTPPKSEEA